MWNRFWGDEGSCDMEDRGRRGGNCSVREVQKFAPVWWKVNGLAQMSTSRSLELVDMLPCMVKGALQV